MKRSLTTRSVSLDKNYRRKIGLSLDRSSLSRFHFFIKGTTEESLNCLLKTQEFKDKLTMLVMVGRSTGMHCLKRERGIGSRSQKVLDD